MLYDIGDAAEVLAWYRDFLPAAPDEVSGFFAFLSIPPGPPFPEELHLRKVCGVVWTQAGEEESDALREARSFGKPLLDGIAPVPVPAWNTAFDAVYPAGDQWYWRGEFIREIPDEAIAVHAEYGPQMPTWKSTMHLYAIDGAASRVDERRDGMVVPGRDLGRCLRGRRSGSGERRRDPRLGARVLRRDQAVRDGRRLRQLPHGRAGPRPWHVRLELRPTRTGQGAVRPGQRVPGQPEHPACGIRGAQWRGRAASCRPLALVVALAGAQEPPGEPGDADHRHDRREDDHDLDELGAGGDEHAGMVRGSTLAAWRRRKRCSRFSAQVEDPELGMDIVDLGLLYDVEVENSTAKVTYSLTSMGCPAGPLIAQDIDSAIRQVEGIQDVELELTFDPPWTPDRMSDDAKFILGFG